MPKMIKGRVKTSIFKVLFIFTSVISVPISATDTSYVIHAGRLIDGISKKAEESVSIVIVDNKIKTVKPGFIDPLAGQQLVDLKEHTVMPGLMDMHVHLGGQPREDGN